MGQKTKQAEQITTLTHEEATRKNIPIAEHQSVVDEDVKTPIQLAYERRNRDLDPLPHLFPRYPQSVQTLTQHAKINSTKKYEKSCTKFCTMITCGSRC